MQEKCCKGCGEVKGLKEFYPHPQMTDGHLNFCKSCACEKTREWRRANLEKAQAYDRKRGHSEERKEAAKVYQRENQEKVRVCKRRWGKNHRYVTRAQCAARRAFLAGELVKQSCRFCGGEAEHMHHEDYTKPLDVIWLCTSCHGKRHRKYEQERELNVPF